MSVWPNAIRVAGVSFRMKDNSELLSDEVWVERIKDNPHDPYAIGVWSIAGNQHKFLGYVPKEIARNIKDEELPVRGGIVWKNPEGLGIRISI